MFIVVNRNGLSKEAAMNVASHHTLDQLKTLYWSNRTYAGYDALRLAAIDAWQKAALDPTIIQSVCRVPYAERIN